LGLIAANCVARALRVGRRSSVETNCVGTAMPISPGQTARSRFAPSTMMGPAMPRVALLNHPKAVSVSVRVKGMQMSQGLDNVPELTKGT
jgi:hypothetical protein